MFNTDIFSLLYETLGEDVSYIIIDYLDDFHFVFCQDTLVYDNLREPIYSREINEKFLFEYYGSNEVYYKMEKKMVKYIHKLQKYNCTSGTFYVSDRKIKECLENVGMKIHLKGVVLSLEPEFELNIIRTKTYKESINFFYKEFHKEIKRIILLKNPLKDILLKYTIKTFDKINKSIIS